MSYQTDFECFIYEGTIIWGCFQREDIPKLIEHIKKLKERGQ